jgi:hypothetical protein
MITEKRPREYAMDILRLDDKEAMQKYMQERVPPEFQEWVKTYVRQWWKIRKKLLA